MNDNREALAFSHTATRLKLWNVRIVVFTLTVLAVAVGALTYFILGYLSNSTFQILPTSSHSPYPTGVVDPAEPSGKAPPGITALRGYQRTYVTDFTGKRLPSGWDVFTGAPPGDPSGVFQKSHVVVGRGVLELLTFKDRKRHNQWTTGGVCQCGRSRTYGAYFVRSRVTGAGPNQVELLWPESNQWPPEIDFNETQGGAKGTTWTIHYGPINQLDQGKVKVNMTQWHTWGVIWTPTTITYVVDGTVWGRVTNAAESPSVPMNLDFEQLTHCSAGRQCPTRPVSMLIDWVAEYSKIPAHP